MAYKISQTKKFISGNDRISEAVRFCLVGGTATLLQYGIYVVFVDAVGVKAVPSTLISYGISFICNYLLTTYFTFHKKPSTHNVIGFICSHLINMGVQTGIVAIFKGLIGNTLALLPALAICVPLNFLMVRFIFKSEKINKKSS